MIRYFPDVNILVYAFREEMPQHQKAANWLNAVLDGDDKLLLFPLVLASVVRIVTNRRIFQPASTSTEALDFLSALIRAANTEVVSDSFENWFVFEDYCRSHAVEGNHVTDAYLATVAMRMEATFVTMDRDFGKYEGLRYLPL